MQNKINTEDKKVNVKFSGLYPFVEDNIMSNEQRLLKQYNFVEFGTRNQYPNYVYDLYNNVPTLGSIINSVVDYAAGDEVKTDNLLWHNEKEVTDFFRKILFNLAVYNGCYINVLRSKFGNVAELAVLDYRNVRSDEKNKFFYYSKDFSNKKTYGRCKTTVYPAFDSKAADVMSSIYFIKGNTLNTYPTPIWAQAQIACEMEKNINEFQLNEINNGFAANVMVNMNNGVPTDEIKSEIEEMFNEKFSGYQNAAIPILTFNADKDHAPTIDKLNVDNFNDRYAAAQERAKQQILTAWRCNGNLVGIPTAQGFNSEEFQSAYQLFYKTVIKPLQTLALNAIDDILGKDNVIEVKPFVIDFGN